LATICSQFIAVTRDLRGSTASFVKSLASWWRNCICCESKPFEVLRQQLPYGTNDSRAPFRFYVSSWYTALPVVLQLTVALHSCLQFVDPALHWFLLICPRRSAAALSAAQDDVFSC